MRSSPSVSSVAFRIVSVALGLAVMSVTFAAGTQAQIRKPFAPSSTIELSPGISYTKGSMRTGRGNLIQSVRVATIWPNNPSVRLRSLLSNDRVVRRELPTRLAQRKSGPGMLAMVATNGDMSTEDRVDAYAAPQSMAVSGGELLVAQACTRPTLGIDSAGGARIDDVRVHITMSLPGRKVTKQIHRVNTHRDDIKPVLFTSRFARSTQTAPGGVEVVLSLPDLLRPNGVQEVRVLDVRRGAGNTPLGLGMAVLSVRGPKNDWVKELRPGQHMRLETTVVRNVNNSCGGKLEAAPGWGDTVEAVGGNHFTLRNGAIAAPSRQVYAASVERHPRTNVGVTADGRLLMVTVDGRQPGYSIGVSLAEMGRLMSSLGAVNAFNMDGGGSTLMAKRSLTTGRFGVANRPSDGRQRMATQALAAFQYTPGY
ncbi:MAG TPA: phosphodiester glycosidase family protein [Candidatus Limnocylindrales bacterium]|nr:phosphodiester glycosidase family protein [Candidatus Limnocylindrales bacterium]